MDSRLGKREGSGGLTVDARLLFKMPGAAAPKRCERRKMRGVLRLRQEVVHIRLRFIFQPGLCSYRKTPLFCKDVY